MCISNSLWLLVETAAWWAVSDGKGICHIDVVSRE
jgi:hypothetical protein